MAARWPVEFGRLTTTLASCLTVKRQVDRSLEITLDLPSP